jgi:hypothetical protein
MGESTKQLLTAWNVPSEWRFAQIESVTTDEGEYYVLLQMERPTRKPPSQFTRKEPFRVGKSRYWLLWQLSRVQWGQWYNLQLAEGRTQKWGLPTVSGAYAAVQEFARHHGHNLEQILAHSRRGTTWIDDPDRPLVYWRVVYAKATGSTRVFAYFAECHNKSLRINPMDPEWEHEQRELPLILVTLEEKLRMANWWQHRQWINQHRKSG